MEIRALNAEKQRDDALDKAAVFRHQFYETASRLEEEQGISVRPDGWKTEYFQRHDKQTKPGVCFKKLNLNAGLPMQICCFPLLCIQIVQMPGKTERAARHMSVQHRTEKPVLCPREKGTRRSKGYGYRRLSGDPCP